MNKSIYIVIAAGLGLAAATAFAATPQPVGLITHLSVKVENNRPRPILRPKGQKITIKNH